SYIGTRPESADIELDNDGAGKGWYFDPNLDDNSEFTPISGFAATGLLGGKADFYSTIAHEVGHAIGFVDIPTAGGHTSDPYDLMNPNLTTNMRLLISSLDASILRDRLGYRVQDPALVRSFMPWE